MSAVRNIKRTIVENVRSLLFSKEQKNRQLFLVTGDPEKQHVEKINKIQNRLHYFAPLLEIIPVDRLPAKRRLDFSLIGFASWPQADKKFLLTRIKHNEVFNFDFDSAVHEGWEYHRLLNALDPAVVTAGISNGKERLSQAFGQLHMQFDRTYIFGTGSSLDSARTRNWNDGIRIVCNTIVKDATTWNHIQPHIVVAGDAIYHFGPAEFAVSFRSDLAKRLKSCPETWFAFPALFYPFCLREFPAFEKQMIPIPQGRGLSIDERPLEQFSLPPVGNVLPSMLLPLACLFSKKVFLWGFDGRGPADKLFWKNSDNHFYSDQVAGLQRMHPAFFDTHVPAGREEGYVQKMHGDVLEQLLSKAEKNGYHFYMMHFSHTPVLQRRLMKGTPETGV